MLQYVVPLSSSNRDTQIYQTVGEPQVYEVPTTSIIQDQQRDSHTYEKAGLSGGDSVKEEIVYHVLEPSRPSSAVEDGKQQAEHAYHVLEGMKGGSAEGQSSTLQHTASSLTTPPPLPKVCVCVACVYVCINTCCVCVFVY